VQPNNYYQPNVFALSTVHGTYQPNISGDSYPNAYAYNNVYYSKPIPYQNGAPVQYLAREEYGQGYSHVPRP
jgi:hypothetical protein